MVAAAGVHIAELF